MPDDHMESKLSLEEMNKKRLEVNRGERFKVTVTHTFEGTFMGFEQRDNGTYAVFNTIGPPNVPKSGSGVRTVRLVDIAEIHV